VPPGLDDGDDDTHYSAGVGLLLAGTTFEISTTYRLPQACGDGDIAEWNGASGTWDCGDDDVGGGEAAWLLGGNAGTTPGTDVLGTNDPVSLTLVVDAVPALRLEPGPVPNLVGGDGANQVTAGVAGATIGGGGNTSTPNRVTDEFGTVGGGSGNQAGNNSSSGLDAIYATVGGGQNSTASSSYAAVGGGASNTASGIGATVGGGYQNTASGGYATVGGGTSNTTSDDVTTISGGEHNTASSAYATIGGGTLNTASGIGATVGGGYYNTASGYASTVGGGHFSYAEAEYTTIAGGGPSDPSSNPTTTNNHVYDDYGTIGGGGNNQAGNDDGDSTDDTYTTIGGGEGNTTSRKYATIGGGYYNTADGFVATIGGGWDNTVSSDHTTISGGALNSASGYGATIPGGIANTAQGQYSFAAGRRAKANTDGCFVWGDSTDADFNCGNPDRFMVRATGGVYLYTNSSLNSGLYLSVGGSSWNTYSDRKRKENFEPVDAQALLARLAAIPITTWNYKAQDPAIRHIGPMAQDFNTLLPDLGGEGEKFINTLDADGVALAAIQGLYAQNVSLQAKSTALTEENAALQTRVDDLETRLAALEQAGMPHPAQASTNWWPLAGLVVLAGITVARRHR
jgi:hypothetical protein